MIEFEKVPCSLNKVFQQMLHLDYQRVKHSKVYGNRMVTYRLGTPNHIFVSPPKLSGAFFSGHLCRWDLLLFKKDSDQNSTK